MKGNLDFLLWIRKSLHLAIMPVLACLLLMFSQMSAAHAMTLKLDSNTTLSFDDGTLDVETGTGQMVSVSLSERGEVVMIAEQLTLDATGSIGEPNWWINSLVLKNAEFPEERIFINQLTIRELAAGALMSDQPPEDVTEMFAETGLVSLENASWIEDEVMVTVDRMTTTPFAFAPLAGGQMMVTDAGLRVDGLTITPLNSDVGNSPFFNQLSARGMSSLTMDVKLDTLSRPVGSDLQVLYLMGADMRGLAGLDLEMAFTVNRDLYSQILPLLSDPDENMAAMISLSSAVSLVNGGVTYTDRDFIDIVMAIAGDEEGIGTEDMRSTVRLLLAQAIQSNFPENSDRLLPPIDSLLKQGGRLDVSLAPMAPVALSSMIGFVMLPDLAIDQLGVQVAYRPN